MWRRTTTEMDKWYKRLGYSIIRTIVLVVRGFGSKNLNDTAKALTFSLIFAIVPILAMIVAIAKGFGVVDVIETQLNKSFLGETNLVPTIMAMVASMVQGMTCTLRYRAEKRYAWTMNGRSRCPFHSVTER